MLVFSRTIGERFVINSSTVVTILRVDGDKVRVGVQGPQGVSVHRAEVEERIKKEKPDVASET